VDTGSVYRALQTAEHSSSTSCRSLPWYRTIHCWLTKVQAFEHCFPKQGRNHWGIGRVRNPPPRKKNWTDHPNFFDEECDYRYTTDCTARNWVYHPHFVLYNNLYQGIGPPNFENVVAPLSLSSLRSSVITSKRTGTRALSIACLTSQHHCFVYGPI